MWWDRFSCYLGSLNKKISPTTLFLPVLINLRIEMNIIQKGKRVGMKHNIPLKGALFIMCVYISCRCR